MNFVYSTLAKAITTTGIIILLGSPLAAETIMLSQLTSAPTLDGSDSDWNTITPTSLKLHKSTEKVTVEISSASIKAGIFEDEVYLLIQWQDKTKDDQHKPFVWNSAKNKYVAGDQMEDRLALQFEMEGNYTVNWVAGQSFKADMKFSSFSTAGIPR